MQVARVPTPIREVLDLTTDDISEPEDEKTVGAGKTYHEILERRMAEKRRDKKKGRSKKHRKEDEDEEKGRRKLDVFKSEHFGWEDPKEMLNADDDQQFFEEKAKAQSEPEKEVAWNEKFAKVGIRVVPFPHQRVAISWMLRKEGTDKDTRLTKASGGVLADVPGLGKTMTTICSILVGKYADSSLHKLNGTTPTPTMVICPKTLLRVWYNECFSKTTLRRRDVHVYYGKKAMAISDAALLKKTIVITTYEVVTSRYKKMVDKNTGDPLPIGKRGILHDTFWTRIVIDEGHLIKNPKSSRHIAIALLRSNRRWCMTGTPYNNSIQDVASLCKYIDIAPYNSIEWWNRAIFKPDDIKVWRSQFLLRRTKKVLNLPPKEEHVVVFDMTEEEMEFYRSIETDTIASFEGYLAATGRMKNSMYQQLLVWMLKLRQATCDMLVLMGREVTLPFSTQSLAKKERYISMCVCCERPLVRKETGRKKKTNSNPKKGKAKGGSRKKSNFKNPLGDNVVFPASKSAGGNSEDEVEDEDDVVMQRVDEEEEEEEEDVPYSSTGDTEYSPTKSNSPTSDYKEFPCKHVACSECCAFKECAVCHFVKQKNLSQPSDEGEGASTRAWTCVPSSRTMAMLDRLKEMLQSDPTNKCLIFSQWTTYLDLIEGALRDSIAAWFPDNADRPKYCRMDGDVHDVGMRDSLVDHFNRSPNCRIMLASVQAGGVGLNLVAANYVFMMDLGYNPAVDMQAVDRSHRIGQTKPVFVYRFMSNSDMDKCIAELHTSKLESAEACLHGKTLDGKKATGSGLNRHEVESMFRTIIDARKEGEGEKNGSPFSRSSKRKRDEGEEKGKPTTPTKRHKGFTLSEAKREEVEEEEEEEELKIPKDLSKLKQTTLDRQSYGLSLHREKDRDEEEEEEGGSLEPQNKKRKRLRKRHDM